MSNHYEEAARRILMSNHATGAPTQSVLDTPWFNKMKPGDKERFIEQYKELLGKEPGFNWGGVAQGAGGGAFAGAVSTLMHQAFKPGSFKPNYFGLVGASLVGTALGGLYGYTEAKKEYTKNLGTAKTVRLGDALDTLIHRSQPTAPSNPYIKWLAEHSIEWPSEYGKTVSDHPIFDEPPQAS